MPPVIQAQRQAPPPADQLILNRSVATLPKDSVDLAAGLIRGVSLITGDREAAGYGVWVDSKTIDTFVAQLTGRPLKAYATHGTWGKDGTLDEVGLWQNPRRDDSGPAPQLREDFAALDAWRKHQPAEFEMLFELAAKAPTEFGASLAFRMTLAWVMPDGSEVATVRKWRECGAWDYEPYFDPPMPVGALRDMPSVRATEVYSADFVDTPAANDGLFRSPARVDAPGKSVTQLFSPPDQPVSRPPMHKILFAKFRDHPKRLTRALELHTSDEKLSADAIIATVEQERSAADLAELRAENQKLTAAVGGHATALGAKDTEIAKLKADLKTAQDNLVALKNTGTSPVPTGEGGEGAPSSGGIALKGVRRAAAAFNAHFAAAGISKPAAPAK